MAVTRHRPVTVLSSMLRTGIIVRAGDTIRTIATGAINFGGGVGGWFEPTLTADGDPVTAPPDYPAPPLRKNSLICQIGGRWFQGGSNASFMSPFDGELILAPNDRYPADNRGGWNVTIVQDRPDVPTTGTRPALQISSMEFVQVTQNRAGEVPMIAGKRTMLRLYVSSGLGSTVDVGSGPGRLGPLSGGLTVASSFGTARLVFTGGMALSPGTYRRDDATHSLQLELPVGLLRGSVRVDVDLVARSPAPGEVGYRATASRTVTFVIPSRFETVLPILLMNPVQGRLEPTFAQYMTVLRGATAVMPIAEGGPVVNPPLVISAAPADLRVGAWWNALLTLLATMIWFFPRTPRNGIRTAVVNAPGGAWGGLGTSFPWGTFISRTDYLESGAPGFAMETFAHEWCHAYGQLHANFCGAGWPYDDRLLATTQDPGCDVANRMIYPSSTSELMSYCGSPRWPSVATYQTAVNALR